jgi:hypothetical protein
MKMGNTVKLTTRTRGDKQGKIVEFTPMKVGVRVNGTDLYEPPYAIKKVESK